MNWKVSIVVILFILLPCYCSLDLGVCYYPEQWIVYNELDGSMDVVRTVNKWKDDLQRMKDLKITHIRVGEFMWSHIQPHSFSSYNWFTLDTIFDLAEQLQGIYIILGTPTATPPKWLIDAYGNNNYFPQYPFSSGNDILPVGPNGSLRKFGSRRHYSFSSPVYWKESAKIVNAMVTRYIQRSSLKYLQIDNEVGCHSTTRSYDKHSLIEFRKWLQKKYQNNIQLLNRLHGNVFWSQEYQSFDEIDLPNLTVTEANPSIMLDWYRFSSDQLNSYVSMQSAIMKEAIQLASRKDVKITTNVMGFFFEFDHYELADQLDLLSYDSYPLGFLISDLGIGNLFTEKERQKYARIGHPDLNGFHHDLYSGAKRSTATGARASYAIMEQQPAPVNWATANPSPHEGAVRLWTLEDIAHGADLVSYFRWRQAPFAQEQNHGALIRRDDSNDVAVGEIQQLTQELPLLNQYFQQSPQLVGKVAIVFDYQTVWVSQIQPQGSDAQYIPLVYEMYSQIRSMGFDVEIVRPGTSLSAFQVVIVPSLPIVSLQAETSFVDFVSHGNDRLLIFGYRSGTKTDSFQIPFDLQSLKSSGVLPFKTVRTESFASGTPIDEWVTFNQANYTFTAWKEWIEIDSTSQLQYQYKCLGSFTDGHCAITEVVPFSQTNNKVHYLAVYPSKQLLKDYLRSVIKEGVKELPEGIRMRTRQGVTFIFNYNNYSVDVSSLIPNDATILVGSSHVKALDVCIFVQ